MADPDHYRVIANLDRPGSVDPGRSPVAQWRRDVEGGPESKLIWAGVGKVATR